MTHSTDFSHHADGSSRPFNGSPVSLRIRRVLGPIRRAHDDAVYLNQRLLDRRFED